MAGCSSASQNLEIRTWYDLDAVRNNLGGHHILVNDLDSTTPGYTELASPIANKGKGWQPIGPFNPARPFEGFTGTFDGQGYEIRDLFINRPDESNVGLFGWVGEGGVIKNLGVMNATVTGEYGVGGLVGGQVYGIVSNSYFSGSVTGMVGVGGLAGLNGKVVSNSYSSANVTGGAEVGGLVGLNTDTVSNSYSTGSVTGDEHVGGLVGWNEGTVGESHSTGSVTGDGDVIGGLVGLNDGTVSNSYFTGSVTSTGAVGGLVGLNSAGLNYGGNVSNSYYNYDDVLINGENIITVGSLFGEDFDQWLDNDKFLDVNERLSREGDYYLINNVNDFKQLLAFGQNDALKFRLTNNLDLGDEPNFYIPYLAGEFDGNGHKISNLSFDFDFVCNVGLFGYLAPGGKVTQVGAENVNITGNENVGGLVGGNWQGTVSNSYSTGSVTGDECVGCLMGYNLGTVSNSYSTGSVTGGQIIGGLVGFHQYGTVSNSYSTGSVTGNSSVGGLVAWNFDTVSDSFWDTETSGQTASAGGMGKITAEMQDIATFSEAAWDIVAVANSGTRDPAHIWNIANGQTYPFLSWQSVV